MVGGAEGLWGMAFQGFFLGVLLTVAVANTLHWLWLRETTYGLYALYVGALFLGYVAISGFAARLMPGSSGLVDAWCGMGYGLSALLGALFVDRLLDLPRRFTPGHWAMMGVVGLSAVMIALSAVGSYQTISRPFHAAILLATLVPLFVSAREALKVSKPHRLFFAAFLAQFCALAFLALEGRTVAHQMALLLHIAALNIGIWWQLRESESTWREAHEEALSASKESEAEAVRIAQSMTRDLSAAKDRAEQALTAELASRHRQVQFVDLISHEFRTPLSVIRSELDVVELTGEREGWPLGERIGKMKRAVDKLVSIFEMGLKQDRLEHDDLSADMRLGELAETLEDVVGRACEINPARTIALDGLAEARPLIVQQDAALLRIAFSNVIENALKYSPTESPIAIRVVKTAMDVAVEVSDRGIGIEGAEIEKVFDKHYRSPRSQKTQGTGIGLYLVKRVVDMHGGIVEAESELGVGTVMTIRLPLEIGSWPGGEGKKATEATEENA